MPGKIFLSNEAGKKGQQLAHMEVFKGQPSFSECFRRMPNLLTGANHPTFQGKLLFQKQDISSSGKNHVSLLLCVHHLFHVSKSHVSITYLSIYLSVYSQFSSFMVVMFYQVTVNIKLVNSELLFLGEILLQAPGYIFTNLSIHTLFHVCLCLKAAYICVCVCVCVCVYI